MRVSSFEQTLHPHIRTWTPPVRVQYPSARPPVQRVMFKTPGWFWALFLPIALLPIPLLLVRPIPPTPTVNLVEQAGQLRISWNVPSRSTVTILDGGEETSVAIMPEQSSLTYARRSGDVMVQMGSATARFIGPPAPAPQIEQLRATVKSLQTKITALQNAQFAGWTKLSTLQADYRIRSATPHRP